MASSIGTWNAAPVDAAVTRSPMAEDTLTSVTALARFEFEPGRGNDGTKIMMIEWEDNDQDRHMTGLWQVSWPGKKTTFAADDNPSDSTNRLYFLLPPGESVPPQITITYQPPSDSATEKAQFPSYDASPRIQTGQDVPKSHGSLHMLVHPLPAIFTPELGATAKAAGRKGVLHTIWAKRRLQVLAKEIEAESERNVEGIALEMALAEKQWIEQNFGLTTSEHKASAAAAGLKLDLSSANSLPISPSMQSPRSPGGRRLTDKLKGLSIMTSDKDFPVGVNTPTRDSNPLSPEVGDMAVSSFSTFKGDRAAASNAPRRIVPISPPSAVTDDQAQSASASLAEIASRHGRLHTVRMDSPAQTTEGDSEDLFAVVMSPRSPDGPKSPFSVPTGDDIGGGSGGAFAKIKGVQTQT